MLEMQRYYKSKAGIRWEGMGEGIVSQKEYNPSAETE